MELWDEYRADRTKTGRALIRGQAVPAGSYRLVVHACLFNGRGELLIQQRQTFKEGWPGLWDLTAGGAPCLGRTAAKPWSGNCGRNWACPSPCREPGPI